jgi:putative endonuclease
MKQGTKQRGAVGESLAVQHLQKEGLAILERNYRFERGEIDIVAQEGDELVFVEVKARSTRLFGSPEEAVTERKQEQIRKVAEGYLYEHAFEHRPCRFDVVAIIFEHGKAHIDHMKNAF